MKATRGQADAKRVQGRAGVASASAFGRGRPQSERTAATDLGNAAFERMLAPRSLRCESGFRCVDRANAASSIRSPGEAGRRSPPATRRQEHPHRPDLLVRGGRSAVGNSSDIGCPTASRISSIDDREHLTHGDGRRRSAAPGCGCAVDTSTAVEDPVVQPGDLLRRRGCGRARGAPGPGRPGAAAGRRCRARPRRRVCLRSAQEHGDAAVPLDLAEQQDGLARGPWTTSRSTCIARTRAVSRPGTQVAISQCGSGSCSRETRSGSCAAKVASGAFPSGSGHFHTAPRPSAQMRDSPPPEGGWMRITVVAGDGPPAALVHRAEPQQPVRRGGGRRLQSAVPVLQQRLRCAGEEPVSPGRSTNTARPPACATSRRLAAPRSRRRRAAPAMSMPARRAGRGGAEEHVAGVGAVGHPDPAAHADSAGSGQPGAVDRRRRVRVALGGPAQRVDPQAPCPPAMPRRARDPPSRWRSPAHCGRPWPARRRCREPRAECS